MINKVNDLLTLPPEKKDNFTPFLSLLNDHRKIFDSFTYEIYILLPDIMYKYQPIQCPYLLKFVDIVLDVEVTTDPIIKLRIRTMVYTKPLVDIHVKYELLSLR